MEKDKNKYIEFGISVVGIFGCLLAILITQL